MAAQLVLRDGMFIDVALVSDGSPRASSRSRSTPPLGRGRDSIFTQDAGYVSALSNKLEAGRLLSGLQATSVRDDGRHLCLGHGLQKAMLEARELEQRSRGPNNGSVGHPHYCCNPCLYFHAGKCQRGADCGFCHACPTDAQLQLDAINKKTLKNMSSAVRDALLGAIVRERLEGIDVLPSGAQFALDEWRHATGGAVEANLPLEVPGIKPSSMRRLLKHLSRGNIHAVCGVARATCEGSAVSTAMQSLLEALRAA